MARFYGNKILSGVMTLEEVPKLWRTQTEKWLKQNNSMQKNSLEIVEPESR